jgi:glyoxylase-like metal-dependent hydrolase (beta-lactamase superfamily II)
MSIDYTIISIGAMGANRLWGETAPVRTAHATTTLLVAGERVILVDPGLPATALNARVNERTGKTLADVTDVFCTTLRPAHRRGLEAMTHATWWASPIEIDTYTAGMADRQVAADRLNSDDAQSHAHELDILERFQPAEDDFSPQISLYPLHGASPGCTGLLLTPPTQTILLASDAAITAEHLQRGQVWSGSFDAEEAIKTLADLLEVADIIICGHDNIALAPRPWM